MASNTTSLVALVSLSLLVIFVCLVVYNYKSLKQYLFLVTTNKKTIHTTNTTRHEQDKKQVMTKYYKPKLVGHSTGKKRVFVTNKGLRVYDVNEFGMPLPAKE